MEGMFSLPRTVSRWFFTSGILKITLNNPAEMTDPNQFTDEGEILIPARRPVHRGEEYDEAGFLQCLSTLFEFFALPISAIIPSMTIKTQLNDSMKDAMKSGDEIRKRTVRMVLAAVKQAEVDKRVELDDMAIMNLIQKEVKNRRESLEEARKADRSDLIEANEAEIKVLEAFLPKAMPAEELRLLVQAAIAETGAASPADMGRVMKTVMPKVAGRAPNDIVSAAVRELLQPK